MIYYLKKRLAFSVSSIIPLLLLIFVLALFVFAANEVGQKQSNSEKEILTKALNRSITQCYALEGTYPPNLHYLEDHYGLNYNADHYYIDYQFIGSNLRPDVTIIERH